MLPQAMNRDHHYARHSLKLLDTATSCTTCPPSGHAFWGYLADAARYFTQALPVHMHEEEHELVRHYPNLPGTDEFEALCAEHHALRSLADGFADSAADLAAEPDDACWEAMRELARHLRHRFEAVLLHEETLTRRLAREALTHA